MKKHMSFVLVICFLAAPWVSAQAQTEEQKTDLIEALSLVKEPLPVPDKVKTGFESITGNDAYTYLSFLASDELEGRDTASPGYAAASQYAASMFRLWGIEPAGDLIKPRRGRFMGTGPAQPAAPRKGYFQNIAFKEILDVSGSILAEWRKGTEKKTNTYVLNQDYTLTAGGTQSFSAPVAFVGYGIQESTLKLDEYSGLDVKGKIVMMLTENPGKDDPDSPFNQGDLKKKYNPQAQPMRRFISPKVELARKMGAVAVIMVENSVEKNKDVADGILAARKVSDERPIFPEPRRRLTLVEGKNDIPMPWDRISVIRVSREMADGILGHTGQSIGGLKGKIESSLKSHSMVLPGVTLTVDIRAKNKLVGSRNVIGLIEGSDPQLKDEVIVIGAHLDHLGKRGDYIFNGADDNGSGSVGVMELAEAFAKNPNKPKRSILFALWTGEEKGLLGSRYYVSHPVFPLKKTVVCLNLDMISREWNASRLKMMSRMMGMEVGDDIMDKIDIKSFISLNYDAHTPELGEILRAGNQYVGLSLLLRKTEEAMGGSDYAPFGLNKVPWVAFMAAMTEDYHQPSDSIEKVSRPLMEKIIRITYLTAYTLADK